MNRGFILVWIVAGVLLKPTLALAEPHLEVSLSRQAVTLKETSILTIQITWPKDEARYVFALPELVLRNLAVERLGESEESIIRSGIQQTKKTFLIELKPLQPGEGHIPEFNIPYIDPSVQKGGSFTISEQKIAILKPPFQFPVQACLAAIAIPLTLFLIWSRLRVQKQAKGREFQTGPTPQEEALEKLKELIARPSSKSDKERLYEWSRGLRQFVADFYGIGSDRLTESEILEKLKTKEIDRHEIEDLYKLFDRLHEAKFIGAEMPDADLKHLQNDLLQYIEGKRVLRHSSGG